MINRPVFIILLSIAMVLPGCAGMQEQKQKKTVTVMLEGNATTGYSWGYTLSPEGIVREVSNEYIADAAREKLAGSGGKFIFSFEAVTAGDAELVFSYLRIWEKEIPPVKVIIYKAIVDEKNNLTLTQQ